MKRLIVLVCAAVLCAGMLPSPLCALMLDHQAMSRGDQSPSQASFECGTADGDIVPCAIADAWASPPEVSVSPLGGHAAEQLFGTGAPASPGDACSIDPHTMCIISASHVYPAVPRGAGDASGTAAPLKDDAPGSEPIQASLVVTGLILVAIAYVRRWKRRVSPDLRNQSLPLARDRTTPKPEDKGKKDKTSSLAA
jgi:hypothetical protein